MTRTELRSASEHLDAAAEHASNDATERLDDLAGQLESLAEGEHGPDHGRLARIQNQLGEVKEDASEGVVSSIDQALDEIVAFRETLDGV